MVFSGHSALLLSLHRPVLFALLNFSLQNWDCVYYLLGILCIWGHKNSYLEGKQAFLLIVQKPLKWENGGGAVEKSDTKSIHFLSFILYFTWNYSILLKLQEIPYRKHTHTQIISMITLTHNLSFLAFPSFPQGKVISPTYFFPIDC